MADPDHLKRLSLRVLRRQSAVKHKLRYGGKPPSSASVSDPFRALRGGACHPTNPEKRQLISEIAEDLCFADASTFSRTFKRKIRLHAK
jgi:AraC-like DNA-binding protein